MIVPGEYYILYHWISYYINAVIIIGVEKYVLGKYLPHTLFSLQLPDKHSVLFVQPFCSSHLAEQGPPQSMSLSP